MHGSRAQILRGIPLFSAVAGGAVARLAEWTVVRRYPRRAMLFRRGDPCRGLLVVVWGRIRVFRADRSGRE